MADTDLCSRNDLPPKGPFRKCCDSVAKLKNHFTFVNYDSIVVITGKLLIITALLESLFALSGALL